MLIIVVVGTLLLILRQRSGIGIDGGRLLQQKPRQDETGSSNADLHAHHRDVALVELAGRGTERMRDGAESVGAKNSATLSRTLR